MKTIDNWLWMVKNFGPKKALQYYISGRKYKWISTNNERIEFLRTVKRFESVEWTI